MPILIRPPDPIPAGEITDRAVFLRRRELLGGALGAAATALLPGCSQDEAPPPLAMPPTPDEITAKVLTTTYNNFYEFGTSKQAPAERAHTLRPRPWSVAIEGEVAKPGVVPLEDLLRPHTPEERVYRFRCVEAWSMVVPWLGIPLGDVLRRFEPTSKAKFVELETLLDPEQMPGQKRDVLEWPYREGLRIDEAVHPLTLLATGMYGETLPNQNGAPLRLIVPWKYGFKSIKSVVRIRLRETQPNTSWSDSAPSEYGFYANVNPAVDHPRWSQKKERVMGNWRKRPTVLFNGYADQVGALYAGMDLRKHF
ncbi:MAG: protein-methionine-sulfoxide reductase catalytic subunit MsrP [Myxococcota bacterium]|nr:protein-methionine-sulfoxide reductase catalytic subunit MsrP [Myxococcota bacterium]